MPVEQAEPLDAEKMVTLMSSDREEEFKVPIEAAMISDLVRNSLPGGDDDDDEDEVVDSEGPLVVDIMRVKKDCLAKVVDFMQQYVRDPMIEISTPLNGDTFEQVRSVRYESCLLLKECVWIRVVFSEGHVLFSVVPTFDNQPFYFSACIVQLLPITYKYQFYSRS
jgi:hypothetical protein